jgi:hypothetical protein
LLLFHANESNNIALCGIRLSLPLNSGLRLYGLPPEKFSNRVGQVGSPLIRSLAGFKVLSAVDGRDRRMMASDGGSAEVILVKR